VQEALQQRRRWCW